MRTYYVLGTEGLTMKRKSKALPRQRFKDEYRQSVSEGPDS